MVVAIVPCATCRGYVGRDVAVFSEEVAGMGPASGGVPCDQHLIHFLLLHKGYGGVKAKESEYTF